VTEVSGGSQLSSGDGWWDAGGSLEISKIQKYLELEC